MRIRLGFVSNSSNTSFVVLASKENTVRSTAMAMLEIRNEDWSEWGNDGSGQRLASMKKAEKKLLSLPENQPVGFSTTNFNTYIMQAGPYILVGSSHNHDWSGVPGKKIDINKHMDVLVQIISSLKMSKKAAKSWEWICKQYKQGVPVGGDVYEWINDLSDVGGFTKLDEMTGIR